MKFIPTIDMTEEEKKEMIEGYIITTLNSLQKNIATLKKILENL